MYKHLETSRECSLSISSGAGRIETPTVFHLLPWNKWLKHKPAYYGIASAILHRRPLQILKWWVFPKNHAILSSEKGPKERPKNLPRVSDSGPAPRKLLGSSEDAILSCCLREFSTLWLQVPIEMVKGTHWHCNCAFFVVQIKNALNASVKVPTSRTYHL